MMYKQYRIAKRDGEIIQQVRTVKTTTTNKWWKPWEYLVEREYSDWVDIPIVELHSSSLDDRVNERFKELAERFGEYPRGVYPGALLFYPKQLQGFSEKIVSECLDVLTSEIVNNENYREKNKIVGDMIESVKKHFGIEE